MIGLALFLALCPVDAVNDECELRAAIELVVDVEGPLNGFSQDETKALLQVTAAEESRWDMSAIGDHGRAKCAMQVWGSNPPNSAECIRVALRKMRESSRLCRHHPLAQYAGGCQRLAAQRISDRRIRIAKRMAKERKRLRLEEAIDWSV